MSLLLASFMGLPGPIMAREANGNFVVCASVINGNSITDAGAEVQVIVIDQPSTTAGRSNDQV